MKEIFILQPHELVLVNWDLWTVGRDTTCLYGLVDEFCSRIPGYNLVISPRVKIQYRVMEQHVAG